MSKARLKQLIWLFLSAATGTVIIGALALLSWVIVYFSSGADPATALNLIPAIPEDLDERLIWLPDHPNVANGRSMEPPTREQIGAAYLRAWAQLAISYEVGYPYGLKSYFSGAALNAVTGTLTETVVAGWDVSRANLHHELELFFYSDDGSIVALTDYDNRVVQYLRNPDLDQDHLVESRGQYQVLMLLEDGNWRIRFWKRIDEGDPFPEDLAAEPAVGLVAPAGAGLTLDGQPFSVAGVSYYPRDASWDDFWPTYDRARTAQDLALMRSLGLNTARIFVPYFDVSSSERLEKMLADLTDFLDQAGATGMKVVVTLFDHRTDHHPANWAADGRYLAALAPPLADHRALLAWDLKNEPDLDYPLYGRALVDNWLIYVAREIRRHDRHHLLTVGWSSPEAAANPSVAAVTDLISYHYLDPAEEYPRRASALRAALPGKPLLLGEFGLSTWDGLFPGGHTEAEQAVHYAAILRTHRQLDSAGYLSWTLYDYTRVNLAQFRTPWRRATQANMGVIRRDGAFKPAAALLNPQADLDLPALPVWHRFTKVFWRAAALIVLWAFLSILWLYRRRTQAR